MSENKKKKILIIEDEEVILNTIAKKLELEGFEVKAAVDGIDGLEKANKERPDLILLDIMMPKLDGFGVLEELQGNKELSLIPVIIISNSGQPVEIERAQKLGVRDYLIKADFEPEEVMEKVRKLFSEDDLAANSAKAEIKNLKKVLLVEDDVMLRNLCSRKLASAGFEVETAFDGEAGLKKVATFKPDMILLDLVLPGIGGFEVLESIRKDQDPTIAKTPVIILSNLGQDSDIQKGESLGASDYLIKATVTTNEIVERVRKILGL